MTPAQALELKFQCHDLGRELSVREYLKELLTSLWEEGEGFSGKRPFGNSGWEYDVYAALVAGGAVKGKIVDGGVSHDFDKAAADALVFEMIDSL